jgi:hypothetical protein
MTGVLYCLLDAEFSPNETGVVLFVSLSVGIGAITYAYEGGQAIFTARRLRLAARIEIFLLAIAIAVGCVAISRLVEFQPGFLYGFVASYTLLAPAALTRTQSAHVVVVPAMGLVALSLIAWSLVIPARDLSSSGGFWASVPEGVVVAVFVTGLEGLFFNMIPVTFMDGSKVMAWSRTVWLALFAVVTFLFWHVLLNKEGAYDDALEQRQVAGALGLLAFYAVVTLVVWAYFRKRVAGHVLPNMGSIRVTLGKLSAWLRSRLPQFGEPS